MKTEKLMFIGIIACAASVMYVGCKKDAITPASPPTVSPVSNAPADKANRVVTQNSSIESAFADAYRQVDMASKQNGLRSSNSCCVVSFTPNDVTTYPKDAVIDYGTSCTGSDGVVRSGKILAHLTNAYTDSASITTVTFDNYYVNSRHITGTEIIVNAGKNFANHHIFNVQIQNGNLYSADGVTAYNSIQQREWIEGDNTLLDPLDDIYMITGTGSGTTTNGENYTLVITTPLRVAVDCAWVESGILEYTVPSLPLVTLNYGSGACDNQATALCGGYTTNIVMP